MAKFRKDDHEDLADSLDRWFYFMRTIERYDDVSDMPESLQQEEGMAIAMRAAHNALSDGEVREAIEARRKWERDRITEMNIAVEEGEARGRAEGKAEGEAAATLAIARSLQASGQPAELIYQVTGLRVDELE